MAEAFTQLVANIVMAIPIIFIPPAFLSPLANQSILIKEAVEKAQQPTPPSSCCS